MTAYISEAAITRRIKRDLTFLSELEPSGTIVWKHEEPDGLFGVPDLVVAIGRKGTVGNVCLLTIAFEVKKSSWKRALVQAFRYASFAHYTIVALDSHFIRPAIANIDRFKIANVGLVGVTRKGALDWHYRPVFMSPYSEILSGKLEALVYRDLSNGYPGPLGPVVWHRAKKAGQSYLSVNARVESL